MTVEELARTLREIEITDFMDGETSDYELYDELPRGMKEIYKKYAEAYLKYFNMERKE